MIQSESHVLCEFPSKFRSFTMLRRNFLQSIPSILTVSSSVGLISHARAQHTRSSDAIVFASTAALTGPLGSLGLNMQRGVEMAFAQANAKGGVHGRKLAFEVMDDAYTPARSVENIKKILGDADVLGLIACLGTPTNAAITPLIEQTTIAHLAPLTGASSLRTNNTQNLFHVRASYTDETRRLVENLVSMGIKDLAMVYLDNPYGKEVLADATKALTAVGIKTVAQAALNTDGKNIDAVVESILGAKPSAVLLGTAGAATLGVVAALRKASSNLPIASISPSFSQDIIDKLGVASKGIAITMVFPDPNRAKSQLVREYQAASKTAGIDTFNGGSLEGYVNGRLMTEAVVRAGRGANREKIRNAIAGIRNFDLGGFAIDYSNKPYVASKYVDLGVFSSDGKLRG
jgi:branched-chain amino acid transport system substrate-binding protein